MSSKSGPETMVVSIIFISMFGISFINKKIPILQLGWQTSCQQEFEIETCHVILQFLFLGYF